MLGKTPERHNPKYWNDGKYPWFSIADMKDKRTVIETKEKVSECSLVENFNSCLSPAGTLIMSFKLTIGRVSILGVDAVHNETIISIFPYLNKNNSIRDWLFYTLGLIVEYVDQTDAIKGSTLNKEKMSRMLIPLPPLNEQNRIISKLISTEPLISKYNDIENRLSVLESEFPEKLKKSILQYAIEGKLVKQDPNDEPASVLLERIKAEKEKLIKEGKIKRDKNESYIYQGDDKNYYEKIFYGIPENWVKLNVLDTLLPMESTKPNCDFQYIDIDSIDNINHMIVRSKATKLEKAPSRATRKLKAGDILFSLVRPYLENVAIVYPNYANCIGSTGFYVCRPRSYIKTEFLFYYLITPYFINGVMKFIKGDNSPSIRNYAIESMLIGLPSLNEQERIVHKIKNLFAQIKQ